MNEKETRLVPIERDETGTYFVDDHLAAVGPTFDAAWEAGITSEEARGIVRNEHGPPGVNTCVRCSGLRKLRAAFDHKGQEDG